MNPMLAKLTEMRTFDDGALRTTGLPDALIERFLATDPALTEAIDEAYAAHLALRSCMSDFLHLDEAAQIAQVQKDFVNFYPEDGVNPYVALAAPALAADVAIALGNLGYKPAEADRAATFNDGPGKVTKCDKTADKWHRFLDPAGTVLPLAPPQVEYTITSLGTGNRLIFHLRRVALKHVDERNRKVFDTRAFETFMSHFAIVVSSDF